MTNPNKATLDKKAETTRKKLGMTVEEMKMLQDTAYGLYSGELGGDMPAQFKDGTCSRAVILETVLDAGRLEQQVRSIARRKNITLSSAVEAFFKSGFKMEDIVGPAFTFARYEVGQPYEVY